MATRTIKQYRPKALIDGAAIDQQPGTHWVAIPDKFAGRQLQVNYGGAIMTIKDWRKEAHAFKRFRDKFWTLGSNRPQYYTLGYFPFVPDKISDKMKARYELRYQVYSGRIIRPDRCENCGKIGTPHGHHKDYSKPLEVMWLCQICHKAQHNKLRDFSLLTKATKDSGGK